MICTNYTVRQVAEITHKNSETVRRWINSGKLKARKPPGCRDHIIKKEDFDLFWYGEPQPEESK